MKPHDNPISIPISEVRDVDGLDIKILNLLREDARRPYTDIGKVLHLSEGAVRQRVKNLVETGIIRRFTVETAEENPRAIVFISTSPKVPVPKIAKNVSALTGVESVMEVAGEYDISVIVLGPDVSSVNQCIDAIREIEGIEGTKTLFVLRKWK